MRGDIPHLLDTADVSQILKVTRPTVRRWHAEGRIRGFRVGREFRFRPRDVERAIDWMRRAEGPRS